MYIVFTKYDTAIKLGNKVELLICYINNTYSTYKNIHIYDCNVTSYIIHRLTIHAGLKLWRHCRCHCSKSFLPLEVAIPTYGHVKALVLKVSILLAQSAFLAAKMDTAISAGLLLQEILPSQFGSIEARIQTRATHHAQHQTV